ncbi:tyrosine-type recombinase/integrase [Paenibacillus sp. ISL-20]|uniref:tyrosine-type recombinase/integrase n=1 Tax=Paenibacillus sp. ISL-20 TaxID=2819163 RepID=UPI003339C821
MDASLELIKGRHLIRDVTIVELMVYAGLRVSEIVRLNIPDYDREGSHIGVLGKGGK